MRCAALSLLSDGSEEEEMRERLQRIIVNVQGYAVV